MTADMVLAVIQSGLLLGTLGIAFKLGAFTGTVNKTLLNVEARLADVANELKLFRESLGEARIIVATLVAQVEDHARRIGELEHA